MLTYGIFARFKDLKIRSVLEGKNTVDNMGSRMYKFTVKEAGRNSPLNFSYMDCIAS